jgi:hypothetical protein
VPKVVLTDFGNTLTIVVFVGINAVDEVLIEKNKAEFFPLINCCNELEEEPNSNNVIVAFIQGGIIQ